jgi:predicted nucleic acid-binding protein
VKVVIADASPINYLILIDCIDVLRRLYGIIVIPPEVLSELTAEGAPEVVRSWMEERPDWIEVESAPEGMPIYAVLDERLLRFGSRSPSPVPYFVPNSMSPIVSC